MEALRFKCEGSFPVYVQDGPGDTKHSHYEVRQFDKLVVIKSDNPTDRAIAEGVLRAKNRRDEAFRILGIENVGTVHAIIDVRHVMY